MGILDTVTFIFLELILGLIVFFIGKRVYAQVEYRFFPKKEYESEETSLMLDLGIKDKELGHKLVITRWTGIQDFSKTGEDAEKLKSEDFQTFTDCEEAVNALNIKESSLVYHTPGWYATEPRIIVNIKKSIQREKNAEFVANDYPSLKLGTSLAEVQEKSGGLDNICKLEMTDKGERITYLIELEFANRDDMLQITGPLLIRYVKLTFLDNSLVTKEQYNLKTEVEKSLAPGKTMLEIMENPMCCMIPTPWVTKDLKEQKDRLLKSSPDLQFGMSLKEVEALLGEKYHLNKEELLENDVTAYTYQWIMERGWYQSTITKCINIKFIDDKVVKISTSNIDYTDVEVE